MTDPRKAIFDTVRAAARPGLFQDAGNVLALDNLLDAFSVPRASSHQLGALSERYESGGRGPGTVSSGKGDPGGVSYGLYQLASKTGTAAAFVKAEGAPWARELAVYPGTPEFSAGWQAIAKREPVAFAAAQHAFIKRSHYDPCVTAVETATGLDLDTRSDAVRDAVWSCAVQHGGAATIITRAVRSIAPNPAAPKTYDRALIEAIYDARCDYVTKLMNSAAPAIRDTFASLLEHRYPAERKSALEMLA